MAAAGHYFISGLPRQAATGRLTQTLNDRFSILAAAALGTTESFNSLKVLKLGHEFGASRADI